MLKFSIPPPRAVFRVAARLIIPAVMILAFAAPSATAGSIVRNGTVDDSGAGFGNVLNVLSLQNNSSEYGAVKWNGSSDDKTGDAKNSSQTRTVAELTSAGITSSNFIIVLNINQNNNQSITLFGFDLIGFKNDGSVLFTISYTPSGGSETLQQVGSGTGNAGHVFEVTFATSGNESTFFNTSTNRIGMEVKSDKAITGSNDGQENFYLTKRTDGGGGGGTVVPAPSAIILAASGLFCLGLGGLRNLRRRQSLAA